MTRALTTACRAATRGFSPLRCYSQSPEATQGPQENKIPRFSPSISRKHAPTHLSEPSLRPFPTNRKTSELARKANIGLPNELIKLKPRLYADRKTYGIHARYAERHTFKRTHLGCELGLHEHPLTVYKLLQYEEKKVEPLWLWIETTPTAKPVVCSYARGYMKRAIWAALRERGYSRIGRALVSDEQRIEKIETAGRRPRRELYGTLSLGLTEPKKIVNAGVEMLTEIARAIVVALEDKLAGVDAGVGGGRGERRPDTKPRWPDSGWIGKTDKMPSR